MGISSNNKNNDKLLSEINVTPFVDVMLVLLVIFMVTAPILYQGVNVNLPKTLSEPIPQKSQKNIIVTVDKEGKIYIEKESLTLSELRIRAKNISRQSPGKEKEEIFLRADEQASYGVVMRVMSEIKNGGLEKVNLITDPYKEKLN
ncbi:MAG: protein TolR [Candidatus Dadabacteria bacterium]|nr:protein TolR [Candidatus Dadabacteria bacterium]NIS07481.1 protein TolR [Candidatus Dadabacteria bacterium]NIV41787.1 protein TolR [Candidatus Dadabacteria bacterium]NIY21120.1 protein TolR [Candidatus Dadabacteria bacterium]